MIFKLSVDCIDGVMDINTYGNILERVGFKEIEITSANVYTKETIEVLGNEKKLQDLYGQLDVQLLDKAYAGALIKAIK